MDELPFSIEKITVNAKTRTLKAEYTYELAKDLHCLHGVPNISVPRIIFPKRFSRKKRKLLRPKLIQKEREKLYNEYLKPLADILSAQIREELDREICRDLFGAVEDGI